MRTAAAATALGLTLIAAAGLAACAPEDPVHPPDPGPSRTPVFASEEEALAAAEDAYEAYLAVANAVAHDGGFNPERYAEVVTHGWLEQEVEAAESLQDSGERQVGDLIVTGMTLQDADISGADVAISVYACLDISETVFVDPSGTDVTPSGRDPIVPFEITFRGSKVGLALSGDGRLRLLVERSDLWVGQDFC